MAMAREPSTGIKPRASPHFPRPVRCRAASPKATMGPPPAARPKAISPMTPVEAMRATNRM